MLDSELSTRACGKREASKLQEQDYHNHRYRDMGHLERFQSKLLLLLEALLSPPFSRSTSRSSLSLDREDGGDKAEIRVAH